MQKLLLLMAAGALISVLLPARQPAHLAPAPPAKGPAGETLLERLDDGHFYVDGTVNGEVVTFLVDTGASDVVLPVETARRIGIAFSESEFTVIASGASGPVRGKLLTFDRVSVDGKEALEVSGAIAEGLEQPLLGQAYLSRLSGVEMSGDYMRLE
jgi:aspartyl protease family protein